MKHHHSEPNKRPLAGPSPQKLCSRRVTTVGETNCLADDSFTGAGFRSIETPHRAGCYWMLCHSPFMLDGRVQEHVVKILRLS